VEGGAAANLKACTFAKVAKDDICCIQEGAVVRSKLFRLSSNREAGVEVSDSAEFDGWACESRWNGVAGFASRKLATMRRHRATACVIAGDARVMGQPLVQTMSWFRKVLRQGLVPTL
jgi:hypothetical protein